MGTTPRPEDDPEAYLDGATLPEAPTTAADWHRVLLGTMRRMDCQDLFDDAVYQLGALLSFTKKEATGD